MASRGTQGHRRAPSAATDLRPTGNLLALPAWLVFDRQFGEADLSQSYRIARVGRQWTPASAQRGSGWCVRIIAGRRAPGLVFASSQTAPLAASAGAKSSSSARQRACGGNGALRRRCRGMAGSLLACRRTSGRLAAVPGVLFLPSPIQPEEPLCLKSPRACVFSSSWPAFQDDGAEENVMG
jgi:hypothetical protein